MNQLINSWLTTLNGIGGAFWNYAAGMFVQSGILIVLLLVVDFLLRKRVRATLRYWIWMLVFVKLVLPPTLSLPTVAIGLVLYALLSRSGPLGGMSLLYRPPAVILGQTVLAFPIVASLVYGALSKMDPELHETLITLGASKRQIVWMTLKEAKIAILSAILAGFGRVIGEIGISMMLGGNIRWFTRTITTAIALETSRGQFELALALGLILLLIAFAVNFSLHWAVRHAR